MFPVSEIFKGIEKFMDRTNKKKDDMALFLDMVAAEAEKLAETWSKILNELQSNQVEVSKKFDEFHSPQNVDPTILRKRMNDFIALNMMQVKTYTSFDAFKDFIDSEYANGPFLKGMWSLSAHRKEARKEFENFLDLHKMTDVTTGEEINIGSLEEAIEGMHKEAGQLKALAAIFRVQ
jgi:hypothetical protein